jgi:quercetin dioxygenase-like cupin family protein
MVPVEFHSLPQSRREGGMYRRPICLAALSAIIAGPALYRSGKLSATKADGYDSTVLATGRFDETGGFDGYLRDLNGDQDAPRWLSLQKPTASSDVYVQSNVWAPGGSTGWHSHPGQSLIIVTAGTVTDYEGHDPDCKPHVYKTGMAFADPGGDHVHILRNEGAVEAKTIAVQFIRAGADRRIEVADPGNCHFLRTAD